MSYGGLDEGLLTEENKIISNYMSQRRFYEKGSLSFHP